MTIHTHFDDKVIVQDESLALRPGQALIVQIETLQVETKESALVRIASNAVNSDSLPADLADQHEEYLYGRPKKEGRDLRAE